MSCVVAPVVGLTTSLSSVPSRSGEERVLRRTVGWFRARAEGFSERAERFSSPACAETSLLHARRPSLWTPLGVIPVASGTVPSTLRDRAASDQGPGHPTVLTGSSLHGGPQWTRTANHARTATSVALGTTLTCRPGTLRIVMWRC